MDLTAAEIAALFATVLQIISEDSQVAADTAAEALEGCTVRSFNDAGVMTSNPGLVLRTPDGSEYQVTVVQSR